MEDTKVITETEDTKTIPETEDTKAIPETEGVFEFNGENYQCTRIYSYRWRDTISAGNISV